MAKFKADLLFFFLVSMIICLIITRKCVDTLLSGFSEKQVSMSCKQAFLLSSTLLWSYTLPWPELTETTIKHKNNLLPEWFLSLIENKECFLCCQQPVEQWGLNQHKNKQTIFYLTEGCLANITNKYFQEEYLCTHTGPERKSHQDTTVTSQCSF